MSAAAESKGPAIGIRHLQAALLFLAICVNYVARLNVSVALVAMTDAATSNPDFPQYDWTGSEKSYILSSFYWGYILTQFPAGILEHLRRFGHHPRNAIRLYTNNLLTGCAECIDALLSSGHGAAKGISYVSAGMCFVWCLLWLLFSANNAPSSRLVGLAEREYIERSMARKDGFHEQKIPVPWRALWTSVPFFALLIVRCAQGWANSTMQLQTPAYMHGVLGMDIKSNALFSALPFLAMWCMSYVYLIFADVAMSREWMSLNMLRKSVNTVAFWGPAAALIGIGFLDKEQTALAIALMTINAGLNAGSGIGSILTIIDMSPNHSGMVMAITNGIGNIFPLVTPLLVGVIVTDETSRGQWQIVFAMTAIVFFFGNLVYIIWGSTNLQPWDAADFLKPRDLEHRPDLPKLKVDQAAIKSVEKTQ
ncbi:putative inorganic phosphate cotransporter [Drosophila busckii]|uniref:putative inorganic phosphate cotransporter n=1 Tax=Drosophila busckii TaxID=30019 RepID=UPI00143318B5|nr:putative inorganic phosphate cotransporter [Drosophila busckii]